MDMGVNMLDLDLQSHKPLREIVYEQLKMQILEGKIEPGTRMMEVNLADEMGVSRTPVREAIRKLEKDGLVVIEPRRGAYASEIPVKDIVDTLVVREELEGLAAALTAQNMTQEIADQLRGTADAYEKAIRVGDTQNIIEHDEEFHRIITEHSDNKSLVQIYGSIQELALRFRYFYYDDFSRYQDMPRAHYHIVEALESGDPDKARQAARRHASDLKEFVIREGKTAFKSHKTQMK